MKNLKVVIRIEYQLRLPQIQQKVSHLREQFETQVCSKNPTAFWKKTKYFIQLSYKEGYKGKPCKSRAIPMNSQFQKLFEEEIKGLLSKGLIRHSKSPWNCYGFYVNKHSELIRGSKACCEL